ncbi:MAG: 1-acyl-sn-glycerol-3-phosphate acyltransferase, partial [Pseudomonadales bacterium]|nr:1-acyl-sn-glycerol-3-phosphate acyltransferase [Pseudomonadales bacterium]
AKKMIVPILPIVIEGTAAALPKHSLSFHGRQQINIRVLPEIPVETCTNMSVNELAQYTRAMIAEQLPQLTAD